MKNKLFLLSLRMFVISVVVLILGACTAGSAKNAVKTAGGGNIRIARQYSIMYAPVYIMEKKNLLEKYLPGYTVSWAELGSGAVINEALAANRLDVAFMGTPPAIIAWDKGIEIRILSNLCIAPLGLQVKSDKIRHLADFTPGDKIAMPGLGSIQHILLSMACERDLGNAHALDNNLVSMTHTDGAMALISGSDLAAHLTALPYLSQENKAGYRTIMDGAEAFGGDYSTILAVATKKFHDENPMAIAGILGALNEAMYLINQRDEEILSIIAETEKITVNEVREFLGWEGTNYTTTLYGLEGFIDFMLKEKFISKRPALNDLLWESAASTIGTRLQTPGILETAQKRSLHE